MPRRAKLVDDTKWGEVAYANRHALLSGYLSMAIRGLGILVLTWTTVVLLGGFVSTLQKKDFWCLTFITLVQTAGIFDVLLTEKLSYIGQYFRAIMDIGYTVASGKVLQIHFSNKADVAMVVKQVVYFVMLCPLAIVYMFGLIISAGISVWRLIERDYGSDAGHGNLKPSLVVLYSLALLQGVIFCYKAIFGFVAKGNVVNSIIERGESGDEIHTPILDYLCETVTGCEKDTSFASGRNLITYAVDLMVSKSPDDYLSGVRILDAFARRLQAVAKDWEEEGTIYIPGAMEESMQRHILMKYLISSASSADILQKLLQTLACRSIYDRETRERAARIVASIAEDISLEDFPRGIQYISTLIDTFGEYCVFQPYERDWLWATYEQNWYRVGRCLPSSDRDKEEISDGDLLNSYKAFVVQGFRILGKLASNSNNCRVMLDTPFLLSKIMAPLTLDLLHQFDHATWSSIVEGSLQVMAFLTRTGGETGTKLRSEISNSKEAINTMEIILKCDLCKVKLHKEVIGILAQLYRDTSTTLETASRERIIKVLVHILTDDNKEEDIRGEAAGALTLLSYKTEKGAMFIMQADDNVIDNLTGMALGRRRYRISVIRLLESLCIRYTIFLKQRASSSIFIVESANDEILRKLEQAMTSAVPELLREIFCWAMEETRTETAQVHQLSFTRLQIDEENQCGDSQDNGLGVNLSSSNQQDCTIQECDVHWILALCFVVWDRLISADQDLAHQFDAVAPRDGASSFPLKLKRIVERSMHLRLDCLRIVRVCCMMVILMMKHRRSYFTEDLDSLMDALSNASNEMLLLDGSWVFNGNRARRSLASLVKEAHDKNNGS